MKHPKFTAKGEGEGNPNRGRGPEEGSMTMPKRLGDVVFHSKWSPSIFDGALAGAVLWGMEFQRSGSWTWLAASTACVSLAHRIYTHERWRR